jgi:hypothetical protein
MRLLDPSHSSYEFDEESLMDPEDLEKAFGVYGPADIDYGRSVKRQLNGKRQTWRQRKINHHYDLKRKILCDRARRHAPPITLPRLSK